MQIHLGLVIFSATKHSKSNESISILKKSISFWKHENIKFIFSVPINKSEEEQKRDRNKGIQEYQVSVFNNILYENLDQ